MKKHMKLIVGFALIAAIITTLLISNSKKIPKVDGEYLVYSSTFGKVNRREHYNNLIDTYGEAFAFVKFERELLSSFEKSKEILASAKSDAEMMRSQIKPETEEQLNEELRSLGYQGLEELELYLQNMHFKTQALSEYVSENIDTFFNDYEATFKPRLVSHILIAPKDLTNPSDEEKALMKSIRDRALNGESFAELAKETSMDGSKDSGGSIGLMDKNSPLVTPFLNAALQQETGRIYDWVESKFGFHLILVDANDRETLLEQKAIYSMIADSNPAINKAVTLGLIQKAEVVFDDAEFETKLMAFLGKKVSE